jgi:hypothetical protein
MRAAPNTGVPIFAVAQIYVDEVIARCQPVLNCLLFFAGVFIVLQHPPSYLSWLEIPSRSLTVSGDWQPSVGLAMYVGSCAVVLAALDGRGSRRVFSALLFPFMSWFGGTVDVLATRVSVVIPSATANVTWVVVVPAAIYGITAALLIVLPTTFLYRGRVVPMAGLVMIPAIARDAAESVRSNAGVALNQSVLFHAHRYASFLILVWVLSSVLCRHVMTNVSLPPDRQIMKRS